MTGYLEWKDDNTLVGEIEGKALLRLSRKIVRQEAKIREKIEKEFGERAIDILGLTTFTHKLIYRDVGFILTIERDMCCLGSVFPGKTAHIRYDDEDDIASAAGIISAMYKRGWKHDFLDRSACVGSESDRTLRKVVGELVDMAKRDIDWYLDVGKPAVEMRRAKIFEGVGRIRSCRGRRKAAKKRG